MGALCNDGIARYIDISTCQQVFEIRPSKAGDKLTSVCSSMDNSSNFIIGTSCCGSLLVYDVTVLMADYDKVSEKAIPSRLLSKNGLQFSRQVQ